MEIGLPEYKVELVGELQQLSDTIDWGIRDLKIPESWSRTKGENVRVMIIDSGFSGHPDLGDNELKKLSKSFVSGEGIHDSTGHGTHVGGIISAQNNAFGVIGVAPLSKIITVKALDSRGMSRGSSLKKSLEYALKIKPDVINMSLGSFQPQPELEPLYKKLIFDYNIPIVCAAGNFDKKGVMYPAKYPYTICVGSYDSKRELSKFSAYSKENFIDFIAPGTKILSTYLDGKYAILSGTSMAAPFVSGILALIISEYKKNGSTYTVEELRNLLTSTSIDVGPKGTDNKFGYGIINIAKALEQLKVAPEEKKSSWRETLITRLKRGNI